MKRVAITGLGLHTSLGASLAATWRRVLDGNAPEPGASINDQGFDRACRLSRSAIEQALLDAGLHAPLPEAASTFSASKPLWQVQSQSWRAPDEIHRHVRQTFGFGGEGRNLVAACATGAYSAAMAAEWIRQGVCEVAVAGSVEPPPVPLYEAGFRRMGVVSPEDVMRPFSAERQGFVFGEGAAALLLESEKHARARGARAKAWLSGHALGADAHSMVAFNSGGDRIADVLRRAIGRAGLEPRQVDHVNAHGTATPLNDALEARALRTVFGLGLERVMVSATKSSTGHLLGAAGSAELVLTVQALLEQTVPPTHHVRTADPACALRLALGTPQPQTIAHAASLSFGFGGPIGALVVSHPDA